MPAADASVLPFPLLAAPDSPLLGLSARPMALHWLSPSPRCTPFMTQQT